MGEETLTVQPPALAIHGGAGAMEPAKLDQAAAHAALEQALDAGWAVLQRKGHAVDAVEQAVRHLEASGVFNAGKGSVAARDGGVALDAAIMDGRTRAAGAVGALSGFAHPVSIARLVAERTPHVLLVGDGAAAFADGAGVARVAAGYFVPAETAIAAAPADTVGAVAVDARGALAAATSTGGVADKLRGRIGDSPVIGAGTYADQRCAVSATGTGEFFIRSVFAFRIAAWVEGGMPLAEAATRALADVEALGGRGGCVALGAAGALALPFSSAGMFRGYVDGAGRRRTAIF
ncbi:MAG TPA: isoaspartyl peptidase/L-asparaginase [Polyangia bacterium]|jgi:beta-aspartyl-peptidase (threonine type)|nr:isoaspartyl peptidase/L-asparaginase [Polyangia bacterium]